MNILSWESSILGSYASTLKEIKSITLDTDTSSCGWTKPIENVSTGDLNNPEECNTDIIVVD